MDIKDFLNKTTTDVDPKAGDILIAAPLMTDPNFMRTVVLVLDREADGSHLGLVLNRELDLTADSLLPDWTGSGDLPLFNGGPVELDRVFMLHTLGSEIKGAIEIIPGLYTGGDNESLRNYMEDASRKGLDLKGKIRFYIGYSGWGQGQLTKEILEHTWAINPEPVVASLMNGSGLDFWTEQVKALGPDYRSWLNIPLHPSLN